MLSVVAQIPDEATRAVLTDLARSQESRDGAPPLSDDALLHMADPARTHLIANQAAEDDAPGGIVGYAQFHDDVAELVGDARTVDRLLNEVEQRHSPVTVWSHGEASPVAPAAVRRGYRATRVLWQLRRPAGLPVPEIGQLPPGVEIRHYRGEQDDARVLAVNSAAFSAHPEQGAWSLDDIRSRVGATWFDPDGLHIASRGEEILGFHWTKIHPDNVGEVYVLAVVPAAQGLHLGRALLDAGLQHLERRGTDGVLLYVEDDNDRALQLYETNGFERYNKDIQLSQ